MNFTLTSRGFAGGEELPARYTRHGGNVSPPLEWSLPPADTRSLVVLCDEPSSPTGNIAHWLVYNLPATTTGLPENLPVLESLANHARQGLNDFNRTGYTGPTAPAAGTKRMLFQVFALNAMLPARDGMTKSALIRAMESRVIARARLTAVVGASPAVHAEIGGYSAADTARTT